MQAAALHQRQSCLKTKLVWDTIIIYGRGELPLKHGSRQDPSAVPKNAVVLGGRQQAIDT